jgi:2Fe-2S ferredoxin
LRELAFSEVTIEGGKLEAPRGCTILDAALDNGILLNHNCRGNCVWPACHVIVIDGTGNLTAMRDDKPDIPGAVIDPAAQRRPACQAQISGDGTVTGPLKLDAQITIHMGKRHGLGEC